MIAPGIHDGVSEAEYHGDSYGMPALSCGCIKDLLDCPQRAYLAHPALGLGADESECDESTFDVGNAAHSLLLEGIDGMQVCDFDSWRTKESKAAREEARLEGKIPLLTHQFEGVVSMVEAAKAFLRTSELAINDIHADGKAERTLVWEDEGIICKCRPDWMPTDMAFTLDYKTTKMSHGANPDRADKLIMQQGWDVQDWFYSKGIYTLTGKDMPFVFLVQEVKEPYLCSLIQLSPSFREIGMHKVDRAMATWKECLKTDTWPAYPSRICHVEPPGWAMMQELSRVEAEGEEE